MKAVPKLEESGQKKVNVVRVMVVRMARVMVKVQLSAFQCFIYQPWDGRAAENKIRLMLIAQINGLHSTNIVPIFQVSKFPHFCLLATSICERCQYQRFQY